MPDKKKGKAVNAGGRKAPDRLGKMRERAGFMAGEPRGGMPRPKPPAKRGRGDFHTLPHGPIPRPRPEPGMGPRGKQPPKGKPGVPVSGKGLPLPPIVKGGLGRPTPTPPVFTLPGGPRPQPRPAPGWRSAPMPALPSAGRPAGSPAAPGSSLLRGRVMSNPKPGSFRPPSR